MSEVAEKAGEKAGVIAAEVVEDSVDGVVEVLEVVRNNPVALAAVGVLGLLAGAAGGYFIANRKLKGHYEELASSEIAEARERYRAAAKISEDGEVLSPMEVLEKHHPEAAASLREYRGEFDEQDEALLAKTETKMMESRRNPSDRILERVVALVDEKTVNVFEDDTFDLEEEMKHRSEDRPYVITHDEFYEGEKEYESASYTYYVVDQTLVDERDTPIADPDRVIGADNLARFGHGSRDENIVFIRDDKEQIDYEIARSSGSYLEEVLGMEPSPRRHGDG